VLALEKGELNATVEVVADGSGRVRLRKDKYTVRALKQKRTFQRCLGSKTARCSLGTSLTLDADDEGKLRESEDVVAVDDGELELWAGVADVHGEDMVGWGIRRWWLSIISNSARPKKDDLRSLPTFHPVTVTFPIFFFSAPCADFTFA